MQGADLVLFVLDSSQKLQAGDKKLYEECRDKAMITVLNKSDLPAKVTPQELKVLGMTAVVSCSCLKQEGVDDLKREIFHFVTRGAANIADETVVSTVRQRDILQGTAEDLARALEACGKRLSSEFVAADIRHALDHLGALVGEVVADDVLEAIFSKFCIGK